MQLQFINAKGYRWIHDLYSKVFSPGMAYVALSRVCSLNGVNLTDFNPASVIVSTNCLEEIN